MNDYIEPKTFEEAESRRLALGKRMLELQAMLTQVNAPARKRFIPDREFAEITRRRAEICKDKDRVSSEMSLVKAWIKQHNKNIARTVLADSEEINKVAGCMVHYAMAARDLIQSLTLRIEELLSENQALHKAIQESSN